MIQDYQHEGEDWRVELWEDLADVFGLDTIHLPDWHAAFLGEGPPLARALKRIYGIGPLDPPSDAGVDDLRLWSREEAAEEAGWTVSEFEAELSAAARTWNLRSDAVRSEAENESSAGETPQAPLVGGAGLDWLRQTAEYSEEQIEEILSFADLDDIRDEGERLFSAKQVVGMRSHFEDPVKAALAAQIVTQKISIRTANQLQRDLADTIRATDDVGIKSKLQAELAKIANTQAGLEEKHEKLVSKLGADDVEFGQEAKMSLASASYMVKAMVEYYSKGDRRLFLGHTSDEWEWMLTATDLRPPQARLDIDILLEDAMRPEHLFDPTYRSPPMPRAECRLLHNLVEKAAAHLQSPLSKMLGKVDPDSPDSDPDAEAPDPTAADQDDSGEAQPSPLHSASAPQGFATPFAADGDADAISFG